MDATATMARESRWVLSLSLLAKCGATPVSLTLLILTILSLFVFSLLYWAVPGGPAWGRYLWTKAYVRTRTYPIPGPRGFPFIGSMSLMTGLAHRKLAVIARRHGAERLMAFSIGETRAVVTGNPDVAKELLTSNAFVDRPAKESAYALMFHRAIGFAPYGVYWRTLRKIAAAHLFSPRQINSSQRQRSEIATEMVAYLEGYSAMEGIEVRHVMKVAALNNVMWSVFGRKYVMGEERSKEVEELHGMVEEGYDLLGKLDWSDHLGWLCNFDLEGIKSRCSQLVPRVNRFVRSIIREHREGATWPGQSQDFVDVLLSLQGTERLSDDDIVAVLWEMIFRGTDTVAVLMEWVMARMVLHPTVQDKVHTELDRVVGRSRHVTEPDLSNLVYLQAIIQETLRLHPPGPLLSWARMSTCDTTLDGHHIPAGTTGMVNMWAITHDPAVWSDPSEFRPERFLEKEGGLGVSVFGSDLRLAPFGSGRRSCPGKIMGMTTVTFWIATLLHEFKWLPVSSDVTRGGVDLSEILRLTCEMAVPLKVRVRPRCQ